MQAIDIAAIERRARRLRAEEMQRLQGLFAERLRLYALLMGNSVLSLLETVGETLRPLFSWNPQASRGPALWVRANRALRGLIAWNPRRRPSC